MRWQMTQTHGCSPDLLSNKRGNQWQEQVKSGRLENVTRLVKRALPNVTATLVTGTIFVGGSYLFFIKLAEYGW